METTPVSHTDTRTLLKSSRQTDEKNVIATPKERLHTVEEFVEKLEQAVLERI